MEKSRLTNFRQYLAGACSLGQKRQGQLALAVVWWEENGILVTLE